MRISTLSLSLVMAFACLGSLSIAGEIISKEPACGCGVKHEAPASLSDLTGCASPAAALSNGCAAPGCDRDCATCGVADCGVAACDTAPCTGECGCTCLRCCNQWTVLAEVMFLRRSDAGATPLILGQDTGATLFRTDDLDFNHVGALRLGLIRDLCSCWGWEIGYLGTDAWNSSVQNGDDVSPILVGPGLPFGSTAPGTVFRVDYGTELYSAEFNLRHRCHECVTLLAGFRWVELGDTLHAYSVAPTVTDFYTLDATNHLYGFQIGAYATLFETAPSRFRIDSISQVGIMGRHTDFNASSPLLGGGGTVSSLSANDNGTGFFGQFGLRGVLQLTDSLAVTGGYNLFWLDGVVLAADQLSSTSLIAPGSTSFNSSTVFFHGATVGIQATF